MWPRSVKDLYPGLEPPASNENEHNFDFYYARMLERITACLESRLGLKLSDDERLLPAVLLFNKYDDPLWCDLGKGYGQGQTKKAIKALEKAREHLSRDRDGNDTCDADVLEEAYEAVADLPRPASIWIDRANELGLDTFRGAIEYLHELYSIQLEEARQWGGNARAKRLAIRLRAIIEYFTSYPVNVGHNPEVPHGIYVECLAEIYDVIGIQVHFYRYANYACGDSVDNEELSKSLMFLESCSKLSN